MGNRINYGNQIVQNGLVLHLDAANPQSFDGNSTTWRDLSGNGNHGTLVGGVTYDNLNKGNMVFDGINDYVNTNYDLSWDNTNSVSINIIIKPNSLTQYLPFLGKLSWEWQFNQRGNRFEFIHWDFSGSNRPRVQLDNFFLSTTDYVNITVVWSHIDGNYYFYRNGVLINTTSFTQSSNNQNRTDTLSIGGNIYRWSTDGSYWSGQIPVVQSYNRDLTQQEVTQNFNALRGRYGI